MNDFIKLAGVILVIFVISFGIPAFVLDEVVGGNARKYLADMATWSGVLLFIALNFALYYTKEKK